MNGYLSILKYIDKNISINLIFYEISSRLFEDFNKLFSVFFIIRVKMLYMGDHYVACYMLF